MTLWDITGDDVVEWAARVEAPTRLPELIRRLLLATATIHSIEMRADGGVRLDGWDGIVSCGEPHPFCPDGTSVWELSTEATPRKLNADYAKRSERTDHEFAAKATYVALCARRLASKTRWAATKRKAQTWRDVRALDADDIATWLGRAPAVARWFGSLLGRQSYFIRTLDEFLDTWKRRTMPPLPANLLVAGRQREHDARRVAHWAERGKGWLHVHGASSEDVLLFAAAALATSNSAEAWRGRVAVVESRDALQWAMRCVTAQPLILLPSYAGFDPAHLDAGTLAVIPVASHQSHSDAIGLDDLPFGVVEEQLKTSGFSEAEAARLAMQSGGNLNALQRLCGFAGVRPWIGDLGGAEAVTLLLLGGWTPGTVGDAEALASMGQHASSIEAMCEKLSEPLYGATAKVFDHWGRPHWQWVSVEDAWIALAARIPTASLKAFAVVARQVLSEEDPKFELPIHRRFAASIHGKNLRHSGPLRRGVAETLVRLARSDALLERAHGPLAGSRLVGDVVRSVLAADWRKWASLGRTVPLLAEASPRVFLECLENGLDRELAHIFEEEDQGGAPQVHIVWGLETIASGGGEFLSRVALLLARLAQADIHAGKPGRVVNRPMGSLAALFHLHMPATDAPLAERLAVLRRVLHNFPEVGFEALVSLLAGARRGYVIHARQPEIAPASALSRAERGERAAVDYLANLSTIVGLAKEAAGLDASKWCRLVSVFRSLGGELESDALVWLLERSPKLQGDRAELCATLRELIHWHGRRAGTAPAALAQWRALYDAVQPDDRVDRIAWLFGPRVYLPEPDVDVADWRAEQSRIEAARQSAISDLWRSSADNSDLLRLAHAASDGHALGRAVARSSLATALEPVLLASVGEEAFPVSVRTGYVAARAFGGLSTDWLADVLGSLVRSGQADDALEIAKGLPDTREMWDLFDRVGPAFAERVWASADRIFVSDSPVETISYAIQRLLGAGNAAVAVDVAASATETVPATLIQASLEALVGEELERFARRTSPGFTLAHLLGRLQKEDGVDGSAMALLELRFLGLLRHEPYRPNHFTAAIAKEPEHFVALVCAAYPERGANGEISDEQRRKMEAADMILDAWRGYPGEGDSAEVRDRELFSWAEVVLRRVDDLGRGALGTNEVCRVLARVPAEGGHWPVVPVRRLLERGAGEGLAHRLHIAKRNLRGGTSRAVGEGGRQERNLAKRYRGSAAALRADWPKTADMLDSLADAYWREARDQDLGARGTRRRSGLDIPTTSDELADANSPETAEDSG